MPGWVTNVTVHVGFAISKLDVEAARRTLETYAELAAIKLAGCD